MTDDLSDRLAKYIFQLMDGDTYMIDDMYKLLCLHGYCDKDGFEIEEEEDEEGEIQLKS